jgi:nucleoside-diphosphate-sugar epimerase
MSPTPVVPKGSLVLITGVNGFLASELALQFLTLGYRVRGTVRALSKATWLTTDVLKSYYDSGAFEVIEVPQIDAPDAFVSAIKGVSIVAHLATFGFSVDPNDIIPREVAAIRSFLTAAKNEPSVKRFVLTSSIVAAATYTPTSTEHVTSTSWNEEAVKAAWAPPPYDSSRLMPVYSASKVEAEKELWRFREEEKPAFVMNAVLPQSIVGKKLNRNAESVSAALIPDLFAGRTAVHDSMIPASEYPFFLCVGVE